MSIGEAGQEEPMVNANLSLDERSDAYELTDSDAGVAGIGSGMRPRPTSLVKRRPNNFYGGPVEHVATPVPELMGTGSPVTR
jgi:hypothetical protein